MFETNVIYMYFIKSANIASFDQNEVFCLLVVM